MIVVSRHAGLSSVLDTTYRPAAVLEAAVSIFVFATRRLHHAIQGREFVNNQLSHESSR
jgi:hypothetical protein